MSCAHFFYFFKIYNAGVAVLTVHSLIVLPCLLVHTFVRAPVSWMCLITTKKP